MHEEARGGFQEIHANDDTSGIECARTLRLASYLIRLALLPLHDASKLRKSSALNGSEPEPMKSAVFSMDPAARNYHLECPTTPGSKGAFPS